MKLSIAFTITFIFALAIITNAFAFGWLISFDLNHYKDELNTKYSFLASTKLFSYEGILPKSKVEYQYKRFHMQKVDMEQIDEIVQKSEVLAQDSNQIGDSMILNYDGKNYLYVISKSGQFKELYLDLEHKNYKYLKSYILAFLVLSSYVLAYLFIMRKLYPLKALKKQINKFGKNQLEDVKYVGDGNDEISEVAKAFYDASLKINKLNSSRKLFFKKYYARA